MMRLRLRIERNALPPVQTLWPVKDTSTTVAQLLTQINDVFPLEADTWGLEDYSIQLAGYDLLHYHPLKDVLKDEDEVVIKPLTWEELKVRMMTGRRQISSDGRHLVDGVAFGRPSLRAPTRPEVRIPPRKRRRLEEGEERVELGEEEAAQLMLTEGNGLLDDEEDSLDDEDFEAEIESEEEDAVSETSSSDEESESSDSSSDDSSSDSDTWDTSSDSDEDEEWQGISNSDSPASALKSSRPLTNAVHPTETQSKTNGAPGAKKNAQSSKESDVPTGDAIGTETDFVGIPNEGKSVTKSRNARRRDAKKLQHLKDNGQISKDTTIAQLRQMRQSGQNALPNGAMETDANAEVDADAQAEVTQTRDASSVPDVEAAASVSDTQSHPQPQDTQATKKRKKAKSNTPSPEKEAELESHRQQLINAIASGGVDIENGINKPSDSQEHSSPPDELPSTKQPGPAATAAGMVPLSVAAAERRSKLDLAGSKRLLFGSLGVRVPKTQADKEALQKKLAEKSQRKSVEKAQAIEAAEARKTAEQPAEEVTDAEAWQDKISLTAVECCDEDVTLSAPPFPFHQRWDPQYNRKGKKRDSSTYMQAGRSKKRKRNNHQATDAGAEQYDKYNTDGYGDALNYDEEGEDDEYWEDGALLDGGEDDGEGDEVYDGFPPLPSDFNVLPLVKQDEARTGDFVTFTELACDATTEWQPKMMPRTAKILKSPTDGDGAGGGLCLIQLSTRDVKPPAFDEDGNRVWGKFEMPQEEGEGEGEGDARVRDVVWGELGVVKLVTRAADADEVLVARS